MSRRRVLAAALVCAAALSGSVQGFDQEKKPATDGTPIKIYATGSFLGQFDGMVLYPGHSRDENARAGLRPYGGLLGAVDWLNKELGPDGPGPRELLLVAGDNASHGFARKLRGTKVDDDGTFAPIDHFWTELGKLNPTAVGLWSEDFYRALAPPTRDADSNAGRFAKWLQQSTLPFLASNAAIRVHKKGLNTVEADDIEVEIDADVSLAWVDSLRVSFDCDRRDLSFVLKEGNSEIDDGALTSKGSSDPCHAEVALKKPLAPGRTYALQIRTAPNRVANFSLHTDRALTPRGDGVPAIVPSDTALPIVVGFVDPAIRKRLPQENWEWKEATDTLDCAGDTCEIIFHAPREAFATIEQWHAPRGERYFALLAGVDDHDAIPLLSESAAVKFVVLQADSNMLGQGASARDAGTPTVPDPSDPAKDLAVPAPPYAGDYGNVGILDGRVPPAARAWVRTQWLGANAATIEAAIARRDPKPPATGGTPNAPEWDLNGLAVKSVAVPGYRMCAQAKAGESVITYFAADHDAMPAPMKRSTKYTFELAVADRYPVYASNLTFDGRNAQGQLWIEAAEFAAMTLDRMRERLDAEVAIMPGNTVDDDYLAYLAAEQDAGRALNWLSREIVRRALFRADRAVRVKIEGAKLAGQLEKIVSVARQKERTYCAAGLGSTSCGLTKIDADHLRVNGRKVNPDHFYGVAMPASVAAEFEFEETDLSSNLIDLVDEPFTRDKGAALDTCSVSPAPPPSPPVPPLAERFESAQAVRARPYYVFKPFSGEFALTELSEPVVDGYRGTFASLPLAGSKADDQKRWALDGGLDAGVDWRSFVLHGIGTLKHGRTRIHPHTDEEPTKTTDPDEYKAGLRFDWRAWPTEAEGRFYAGFFQEGELSADMVFGAKDEWPEPIEKKRRRYRYATVGAEVDNWRKWGDLSLKQIRLGASRGTSFAEQTGIHINEGDPVPLTEPLGDILKREKDAGTDVQKLRFAYQATRRTRVEAEALFDYSLYESAGRKGKLTFATKYFFYFDTPNSAVRFVERHNAAGSFELTFPIWRVFDGGVKIENQRVWLKDGKLYSVFRTSATIKWPLFGKRGAGMIW